MKTLYKLPKHAQKFWKRVSSTDTWGCDYVYEHGARLIWNAAIRHERRRVAKLAASKVRP